MSINVSDFQKISGAVVTADRHSRALGVFKQGLRRVVFIKIDFCKRFAILANLMCASWKQCNSISILPASTATASLPSFP